MTEGTSNDIEYRMTLKKLKRNARGRQMTVMTLIPKERMRKIKKNLRKVPKPVTQPLEKILKRVLLILMT